MDGSRFFFKIQYFFRAEQEPMERSQLKTGKPLKDFSLKSGSSTYNEYPQIMARNSIILLATYFQG